jgi:hypothetical protein
VRASAREGLTPPLQGRGGLVLKNKTSFFKTSLKKLASDPQEKFFIAVARAGGEAILFVVFVYLVSF